MRKPVFVICEQQRRRSACASAQSDQQVAQADQHLYYSQFESYLVENPEDRFSCDVAQFMSVER